MVLDEDTGYVFYSKNSTEQIRPASTTKILTAIIVLERLDLSTEITVGSEIDGLPAGSSLMGVVKGEVVTVEQLLYGLMLRSGNDAAVVLAKAVAESIDGFAELMNEKAEEIGMANSHFVNPNGLDNDEHYTTVEDMALLTRYALKNYPELKSICSAKTYIMSATNKSEQREIHNTNKLIYNATEEEDEKYLYANATGLKTGSTKLAGGCLVSTATEGSQNLIALVFGDMSKSADGKSTGIDRWKISTTLLDFGFDNYENLDMASALADVDMSVQVEGAADVDAEGGQLKCTPVIGDEAIVTVAQGITETGATEITAEVTPAPGLTAPIKKGDIVGSAVYSLGDTVIYRGDVAASRDVMSQDEYDKQREAGLITPIDTAAPDDKSLIESAQETG